MRRAAPYLALAGYLGLFLAAALSTIPPAPPGADAAQADRFDVARALRHVERVAREPHPAGGAANAGVLDYLLAEIAALGLEAEVQRESVEAPPWLPDLPWIQAPERAAGDGERARIPLSNVLVRVRGAGEGGAVLLQAHYDSHPAAPGAGDAAACVAAALETLRVIAAEARATPPRNDLIVHLDDGEELGLLGARLFAERHPWIDDVRAVINLDARGNAGTPILFETGPGSGALVRAFARAHPRPVGASLAAAVYARMRNDTSFTPLRERGLPGINLACVGGASVYHRPSDTAESLSRRTLQRFGEYALAATRATLALDLERLPRDEVAFFNAGLGGMLVHPLWWSRALLLVPLALVARLALRARRAGLGLARGLARALGLGLAALAAGLCAWALARGLAAAAAALGLVFEGVERGNLASATLEGFGVLIAGAGAALLVLARRAASARALGESAAGGALLWAGLAAAFAALLPGASYAFTLPLAFLAPALAATVERDRPPRLLVRVYAVFSFVLVATLLAPLFHLLVQVGSLRPARAATIAAALTALGVTLFQPQLCSCLPRAGRGTAWAALAAGAATCLAGALADLAGR